MTTEQVVAEVERIGLPEALDRISLSDIPVELQSAWHEAVVALDAYKYRENLLRSELKVEARERAGREGR